MKLLLWRLTVVVVFLALAFTTTGTVSFFLVFCAGNNKKTTQKITTATATTTEALYWNDETASNADRNDGRRRDLRIARDNRNGTLTGGAETTVCPPNYKLYEIIVDGKAIAVSTDNIMLPPPEVAQSLPPPIQIVRQNTSSVSFEVHYLESSFFATMAANAIVAAQSSSNSSFFRDDDGEFVVDARQVFVEYEKTAFGQIYRRSIVNPSGEEEIASQASSRRQRNSSNDGDNNVITAHCSTMGNFANVNVHAVYESDDDSNNCINNNNPYCQTPKTTIEYRFVLICSPKCGRENNHVAVLTNNSSNIMLENENTAAFEKDNRGFLPLFFSKKKGILRKKGYRNPVNEFKDNMLVAVKWDGGPVIEDDVDNNAFDMVLPGGVAAASVRPIKDFLAIAQVRPSHLDGQDDLIRGIAASKADEIYFQASRTEQDQMHATMERIYGSVYTSLGTGYNAMYQYWAKTHPRRTPLRTLKYLFKRRKDFSSKWMEGQKYFPGYPNGYYRDTTDNTRVQQALHAGDESISFRRRD